LQHERSGQGGVGEGTSLPDLAKSYVGVDATGRIADAALRSRITQNLIDAHAHQLTTERAAAEARGNQNPSATTSIMKNSGTRIGQERAELVLEIMGCQGLGWAGDDYSHEEIQAVRSWLFGKANTIAGGSFEVQNNIITKRILGLPELTGKV
jgi:alkylation response protein AidB-like acyl-CoA dehydrogenase